MYITEKNSTSKPLLTSPLETERVHKILYGQRYFYDLNLFLKFFISDDLKI